MRKSIALISVKIGIWFVSSVFIMWGWNTVAPHLNCPLFGFWEIFAMRMALSSIVRILWNRPLELDEIED